jgi:hypothetical protein
MAMRFPQRATPVSVGQTQSNQVATGFFDGALGQMGITLPLAMGIAATVDSDPLWVAGFDNFMLIETFTAGGGTSVSFQYVILDPRTLAPLAVRTIQAGVVAGTNLVQTFGASSQTAAVATRGDAWIVFRLRLVTSGAGAGITVTYMSLWCGVR